MKDEMCCVWGDFAPSLSFRIWPFLCSPWNFSCLLLKEVFLSLKLLAEYDKIRNIYQVKVSDLFLFINVDVQFMGNVNL